jgi:epoxide hydrolase-like predicted phosphatase
MTRPLPPDDREPDTGIDAVLFDFTGVLSTSPRTAIRTSLDDGVEIDPMVVLDVLLGPFAADGAHPWHDLECGRITMDEFERAIEPLWRKHGLTSFPPPPRGEQFLAAIEPVPEMVELAHDLRSAGYRTAIVSNNVREWARWQEVWHAQDLVDVVIDSCEVGLRKPNPAIWELAIERLGDPPIERCLFLDDFPWNVEPAAELGLQTMLVSDPVVTAREVRARLLDPSTAVDG